MGTIFIGHAALSFLTGLSVSVSGFGCEVSRELVAELTAVRYESSAINMGLSAALVTGVQVSVDVDYRGQEGAIFRLSSHILFAQVCGI